MNTDKIKLDIEIRISEINESMDKYHWRNQYKDSLLGAELEPLEKLLKRVSLQFKIYNIAAIVFSVFLIIVSLVTFLNDQKNDFVNMDKIGLLVICTLGIVFNSFGHYKLKTNLENKIFLIKLWEKIDGEL